jgi:hypothetical protein
MTLWTFLLLVVTVLATTSETIPVQGCNLEVQDCVDETAIDNRVRFNCNWTTPDDRYPYQPKPLPVSANSYSILRHHIRCTTGRIGLAGQNVGANESITLKQLDTYIFNAYTLPIFSDNLNSFPHSRSPLTSH